jgi:hypothetical protein
VIRNPDRKVLVLWLVAMAMITWGELRRGARMPQPRAYVASGIVYGLAAVLAEVAGDVAVFAAFGWTLTVAVNVLGAPSSDEGGRDGGGGDLGLGARADEATSGRPRGGAAGAAGGRRRRRRRAPTTRRRVRLASGSQRRRG